MIITLSQTDPRTLESLIQPCLHNVALQATLVPAAPQDHLAALEAQVKTC